MISEQFADLLLGSPAGQICASNIVSGLALGALDRGAAAEVLAWWEHLAVHAQYTIPEEVALAVNIVRDRAFPDSLPHREQCPDFRLRGPRAVGAADLQSEVCCAVPLALLPNVISEQDFRRFQAKGIRFPARATIPGALNALEALSELSPNDRKVSLHLEKTIGGLVWFAKKEHFTKMLRSVKKEDAADRVRDAMGLAHRIKDEILVLLTFPAAILTTLMPARPTFVDAGDHSRFKVLPDGARARQKSAWGWTANLDKFYSGKADIDGCPENICAAITAAAIPKTGGVSFKVLGSLKIPRNDLGDHWDIEFARRLRGNLSLDDLKIELMNLG